jgi:hypothetical protein
VRLAAAAGVLATLVPRLAAACPACAGNNRGGGARLVLLGSFILLPFVLFAAVARIIRGLDRDRPDSPPYRPDDPEPE